MNALYEPAAIEEVREATEWYLVEAGQRIATEFLQEIESKVALLMLHPKMGTPGANQIRSMQLKVFPYTLHYKAEADAIRIFAFAHQRRRPGYWRKR